jgi:H/ACA ribonucleoprotein complex subunit 4
MLPAERPRKRLVRMVSNTDPNHGKRPEDRDVHELLACGVVLLDKPSGPSSHQVTAWLRKALDIEKVGHGGTLDPNVTGALPVTIGAGTKAVQSLLTSGKEYIAVMRMHEDRTPEQIHRTAAKFVGKINQTPPVRSAVKRRPRIRRVYYLDVIEINGRDVLFRVGCQAGTYIRNLCVDMSRDMGTNGHMQELRRTRTGLFDESQLVTLHDALDAKHFLVDGDDSWMLKVVRPIEAVTQHLPKLVLRDSAIEAICHGAPLAVIGIAQLDEAIEQDEIVALYSLKGELVALGRSKMTTKLMMNEEKGIAAVPERIIMKKGTYPRVWKRS